MPLAGALLDRFGSLAGVVAADCVALAGIGGASRDIAAPQASARSDDARIAHRSLPTASHQLVEGARVDYARTTMANRPREQFRSLYLDRRDVS